MGLRIPPIIKVVREEPVEPVEPVEPGDPGEPGDAARGVFTQPYREVLTMKVYRPPVPMRGVQGAARGQLVLRVDRGVM
tara:strand:- start:291 stop:527 length:237 start_codon:yes stop_codon:yes gene_type:complete